MSTVSNPSSCTASAPRYEVEVLRDVRIPTAERDVTLSADVYLPVGAREVPALVSLMPYRKDVGTDVEEQPTFRWFAKRGYASVLVDFRGTGSSDGATRLPFVAGEADDGVAAIEWAAAQPWSSGAVGMWGVSYGSLTTMRTAARRPPALRAIMPVMGGLDAARALVHPHGARGAQAPISFWATMMLMLQLLPPLHDFHDVEEQRRWRRRLHDAEPWMLHMFRHGPGDPVWRESAVDGSAIEVPSYCVAGWRDVFVHHQVHAYEQIKAPKKLLVGPWMHRLPQWSVVEPIGFLPMALRWWDHWLRGIDNGVMDEPAVTLYTQGSRPGWRGYASWPPANGRLALATATDTTLSEPKPSAGQQAGVIAEYQPDPTIGSQAGLWTMAAAVFGLPLEQHEDDMRSVCATSEPLAEDIVISGRAEAIVRLAEESAAVARRLVVRLCDVDPRGRSTLITCGMACPEDAASSQPVLLYPITHRIPAGHRLRVALSDSDFPRLWPLADAPVLRLTGIELIAPIVSETAGTPIEIPAAEEDPGEQPLALSGEPCWRITREPIHDSVEIVSGGIGASYTTGRENLLETSLECRASVRRQEPQAAAIDATHTHTVRLSTGELIDVKASSRITQTTLWAHGEVSINGTTVYCRDWEEHYNHDS